MQLVFLITPITSIPVDHMATDLQAFLCRKWDEQEKERVRAMCKADKAADMLQGAAAKAKRLMRQYDDDYDNMNNLKVQHAMEEVVLRAEIASRELAERLKMEKKSMAAKLVALKCSLASKRKAAAEFKRQYKAIRAGAMKKKR